jgi:hypothetical protein
MLLDEKQGNGGKVLGRIDIQRSQIMTTARWTDGIPKALPVITGGRGWYSAHRGAFVQGA